MNKKNVTYTFNCSFFRRLNTTIYYPPVTYGASMRPVDLVENTIPDHKIFVFVLITPAGKQIEVPDRKYEPPEEGQYYGENVPTHVHFGSIISDAFHVECVEEAKEEAEDQGQATGSS